VRGVETRYPTPSRGILARLKRHKLPGYHPWAARRGVGESLDAIARHAIARGWRFWVRAAVDGEPVEVCGARRIVEVHHATPLALWISRELP